MKVPTLILPIGHVTASVAGYIAGMPTSGVIPTPVVTKDPTTPTMPPGTPVTYTKDFDLDIKNIWIWIEKHRHEGPVTKDPVSALGFVNGDEDVYPLEANASSPMKVNQRILNSGERFVSVGYNGVQQWISLCEGSNHQDADRADYNLKLFGGGHCPPALTGPCVYANISNNERGGPMQHHGWSIWQQQKFHWPVEGYCQHLKKGPLWLQIRRR
jgi:hypothetical protein